MSDASAGLISKPASAAAGRRSRPLVRIKDLRGKSATAEEIGPNVLRGEIGEGQYYKDTGGCVELDHFVTCNSVPDAELFSSLWNADPDLTPHASIKSIGRCKVSRLLSGKIEHPDAASEISDQGFHRIVTFSAAAAISSVYI